MLAEMPVTMSGTHPLITGTINGSPARFLADSGAFFSILTSQTATRLGLKLGPLPPNIIVTGTGGVERMKLTTVPQFALTGYGGGYTFKKVDFLVSGGTFGAGIDGIIGQNFLGRGDTEFDLANGFIRVFEAKGCKGPGLAYWADESTQIAELAFKKRTSEQPLLIANARINGKKIKVILDTGAFRSILTLRAASRAGIEPEDEDVTAAGLSRGIGKKSSENSIALFDTLDLGGELIKNARLRIGDIKLGEADMLLGADFFLSHRIYVDSHSNMVYFTYNGGPVFDLSDDDEIQAQDDSAPVEGEGVGSEPGVALPDTASLEATAPIGDSPLDVAGPAAVPPAATPKSEAALAGSREEAARLRRRGTASAGRRDFAAAIADYDRAIQLDPTDPETRYERALAYAQTGRATPALADLAETLRLEPGNVQALMLRGMIRVGTGDAAGGGEDFAAAQRLAPESPELPLEAASAFGGAGNLDEAIAQLDSWLAKYPKDERRSATLLQRCRLRAMTTIDLPQALADCDMALKKGERTSVGYGTRALVHLLLGAHAKAIDDYDEALDLQPKDASSLYGRGLARLRQGQAEEGEQDLAAALAIDAEVATQFTALGLTR
jgi:tetratricopeptide (TPR) repeat protein/predicted aspartyl protease